MKKYRNTVSYSILKYALLISTTALLCLMLGGCSKKTEDLRSIGYSEPIKESQISKLTLESEITGRKMRCMIYLPKGYGDGKEYPVWYGMNGSSTNETMWIDNGVAKDADELIANGEIEPLIMVFPFARDATIQEITKDAEDGKIDERNMDKFICQELVPYIDSHYFTKTSADSRYIGGFSMGGMIALRVGLHHTDLFSKIGGYSPAVPSSDYSDRQLEKWLFPNDDIDAIDDIIKFDKKKGFNKLDIYLNAGKSNDPFSVGVESLYKALQERGVKSQFELHDGGHELIVSSIKDYLKFYVAKD
jgi:enterochelin esterase-like enzyme